MRPDEAKWVARVGAAMPSTRPHAQLVPLVEDVEAAVGLATEALEHAARTETPPQDPAPIVTWATERIRAGSIEGRLMSTGPRARGLVLWEGTPELGREVKVVHLDGESRSPALYATLLGLAEREAGPFSLLPASWKGLTVTEEETLLLDRGYLRFARSEMRLPAEAAVPSAPAPSSWAMRPVRRDDEPVLTALHAAAFRGHFDSYLFRSEPDPVRDSAVAVHDMLTGRWGEFLPWASFLASTTEGSPLGSSMFVRAPYGPLLVSLQVDPSAQGRGIGRALTIASVRALRERRETVIALNVTEGNAPAVHLYESLGFVRSIGPGWKWYSARLVPVGPDGVPNRPRVPAPDGFGSTGSGAHRTPPT